MSDAPILRPGDKPIFKISYITWDYNEQPDFGELNECLNNVFDGKHCPHIEPVDTKASVLAAVISSRELDEGAAQAFWNAKMEEMNRD